VSAARLLDHRIIGSSMLRSASLGSRPPSRRMYATSSIALTTLAVT
jgi:hypothetical protein